MKKSEVVRRLPRRLRLVALLLVWAGCRAAPTSADTPEPFAFDAAADRLRAAAQTAGVDYPLTDVRLQVDKSDRELMLWSGETLVRRYHLGLGRRPEGAKQRLGDHRTPQGAFRICYRNARSRFHLFLGIDYPNRPDAERGLAAELIDRRQHDAIVAAIDAGRRPPWDTPLGGEIGVHGGGSHEDWTAGCMAVTNWQIEELWLATRLGTPIEITP